MRPFFAGLHIAASSFCFDVVNDLPLDFEQPLIFAIKAALKAENTANAAGGLADAFVTPVKIFPAKVGSVRGGAFFPEGLGEVCGLLPGGGAFQMSVLGR